MLIADGAQVLACGVYDLPGLKPGNYHIDAFDGSGLIPVTGVCANLTVYAQHNYLVETPAMNGDMRRFDIFRMVKVRDTWWAVDHTFYYTDGRGNT